MTKKEGKLCFCVLAFRNTLKPSEMKQLLQMIPLRLLPKEKREYGTGIKCPILKRFLP